jgi:hypothetical protein
VKDRPELLVRESANTLEIESPMRAGKRVLFLLLALFPLVAPYELLFKPRWTGFVNIFFLFSALVSLGAAGVSAFLVFAAVAGIRSRMRFDRARGTFTYTASSPATGARASEHPLASVTDLSVFTHEWSDGAPSYSLKVELAGGRFFATSSSWSREEVEGIRTRAAAFLV